MYEFVYQDQVLFSYCSEHIFNKMYMECSFRAKSDEAVTVITEDEKAFVIDHVASAVRDLSLMFGDAYVPSSFSEDGCEDFFFRVKCRNGGQDAPELESQDVVMENWIFYKLMKEWGMTNGIASLTKDFEEKEEQAFKEVEKAIKTLSGRWYWRSYTVESLN